MNNAGLSEPSLYLKSYKMLSAGQKYRASIAKLILQKKTGSGSFANITAANGAADGSKTSVLSSTFQDNLYTNFTVAYSYLDTAGSTDALSYRLVYYNTSSSTRTVYRNRASNESDDYSSVRGGSWIQAMEVSA